MRTPLIAGNWKMNGSKPMVRELVSGILASLDPSRDVELLLIPPSTYVAMVSSLIEATPLRLGGQDVSVHESGAFTGEIAGSMLSEFGCQYVLVGHSERRSLHGESNEEVAAKFVAAQGAGLQPILCVGETLEQRQGGETETVVGHQVAAVIERAGIAAFSKAVLAYEPVWAIGTGETASPDQAQAVHAFIREQIARENATIAGRLRIVYGGSVKGDNAPDLFARDDIDGGLIGGASLTAESFMAIYRAA